MTHQHTQPSESGNFLKSVADIVRNPWIAIPSVVIIGGVAISMNQASQREAAGNIVTQKREVTSDFYNLVENLSQEPAILSTSELVFEVDGIDLYEQTKEQLAATPDFAETYEENKDIIDATLLKSTTALGLYHDGDDIAVTKLSLDNAGTSVYITQFVTDESTSLTFEDWGVRLTDPNMLVKDVPAIPLPAAEGIPTPETN